MDLAPFDHERHIRRAIELAETAAERGDDPYGAVLVRDDEVVAEASNRVHSDDDVALHPELTLARQAASEHSIADRASSVLYASTEPCPMCATGIAAADVGAVAYSVPGARAREARRSGGASGAETGGSDDPGADGEPAAGDVDDATEGIPCEEVFDRLGRSVEVVGPVLESEGLDLHRRHRG